MSDLIGNPEDRFSHDKVQITSSFVNFVVPRVHCSDPARISKRQVAGAKRAQCQNKKGHLSLEPHKCISAPTYDYLTFPL